MNDPGFADHDFQAFLENPAAASLLIISGRRQWFLPGSPPPFLSMIYLHPMAIGLSSIGIAYAEMGKFP